MPPDRDNRGDGKNVRDHEKGPPPEGGKRFEENAQQWKKLPADMRDKMRERFRQNREKAKADALRIYTELGLQLDEPQKELFFKRYFEERRKIEERLYKELEAKRRVELKAVVKLLDEEFKNLPATAVSASASPKADATPAVSKPESDDSPSHEAESSPVPK
jgi:hypothetical protein